MSKRQAILLFYLVILFMCVSLFMFIVSCSSLIGCPGKKTDVSSKHCNMEMPFYAAYIYKNDTSLMNNLFVEPELTLILSSPVCINSLKDFDYTVSNNRKTADLIVEVVFSHFKDSVKLVRIKCLNFKDHYDCPIDILKPFFEESDYKLLEQSYLKQSGVWEETILGRNVLFFEHK